MRIPPKKSWLMPSLLTQPNLARLLVSAPVSADPVYDKFDSIVEPQT
jgi:hypothetical protein